MIPLPNETRDAYAKRWRESVEPLKGKVLMGTAALSGGKDAKDISRDEEDYFWVTEEMDYFWVGSWVTGFGFYNVKFPKATSRKPTDEEWEWFLDHPVSL